MQNLAVSQQNIWNLQKYYTRTTISAICGAIYFKDGIGAEILKKAINHVIEHQDSLRLRFCKMNGKAMQQVTEYQYEKIPVLRFSDKESLRRYVLQRTQKLTGLTNISLYHFTVFRLNEQTGIVTALSHLIPGCQSRTSSNRAVRSHSPPAISLCPPRRYCPASSR